MKNFLKNFLKIILVIIIALVIDFLLSDILCYLKENGRTLRDLGEPALYSVKKKDFNLKEAESQYRKPCGLEYKKAPILIYGSSFAYGFKLKDDENLGYLLSEITKRPVYNFALGGFGIQHSLYIMQNQEPIEPAPEFVIYIYAHDIIRRMFLPCSNIDFENFFRYKEKNNEFVLDESRFPLITNSLFYRTIQSDFVYGKISQKEKYKTLKMYLKEMKKDINKKYPDAKFVFVIYDREIVKELDFTEELMNDIRNLGIDVISLDKIFGDTLNNEENRMKEIYNHPSAAAWQKIAPAIAEIEKM